jgi:hypothetical protein
MSLLRFASSERWIEPRMPLTMMSGPARPPALRLRLLAPVAPAPE